MRHRSPIVNPHRASVAPRAACSASAAAAIAVEQFSCAQHVLAPAGPDAIRLCRYSGVNAHPRLALVGSLLLDGRSSVDQLVTDFDRLPSLHGAVACPNDDASQILALLA